MFVLMNEKDIQSFSKLFVYGNTNKITTQTSREPITLEHKDESQNDSLCDRLGVDESLLEKIYEDLLEKLLAYATEVEMIRERDDKFCKAQLIEEKRQKLVEKKLKQTLKH